MHTRVAGPQDVFGMTEIGGHLWAIALSLSIAPGLCDELLKAKHRADDHAEKYWLRMDDGFTSVLSELRNLRQHVSDLEHKLHVREYQPLRRSSSARPASTRGPSAMEAALRVHVVGVDEEKDESGRAESITPGGVELAEHEHAL